MEGFFICGAYRNGICADFSVGCDCVKGQKRTTSSRAALYGVLVALAMILSYVETLIPINLGVPGVKPGLANLVVFVCLYLLGSSDAFFISIVRITLVAFTFGNLSAFLYSLAGGLLSFGVMWFCKSRNLLSKTGVSIAGGVAHNVGQLTVAALVLETAAVYTYFPVLLLAGTAAGTLIGLLGTLILKRLPQM